MIWAAVASMVSLGVVLVVADPPVPHDDEDLAAAGWSPAMVTLVSWTVAAFVAFGVFAVLLAATGSRGAPAAGFAAGAWMPVLVPTRLRRAILDAHSRRQASRAALVGCAGCACTRRWGCPCVTPPWKPPTRPPSGRFGPVASAIAVALEGGRDPLTAAAQRVRGSAAETLLGTVDTVERSGAAGAGLIDHVVDRAIAVYAAAGAERTDRLGRTTGTLGTIVVAFGVLVLMLGIAVAINTGVGP